MPGFKDSFSKGITTINVKTNTFIEEAKIKTHIASLQNRMDDLYTAIGKTIYHGWRTCGKWEQDPVLSLLNDIRSIEEESLAEQEKITDMRNRANQILGVKVEGQDFCPICGSKKCCW